MNNPNHSQIIRERALVIRDTRKLYQVAIIKLQYSNWETSLLFIRQRSERKMDTEKVCFVFGWTLMNTHL